LNDDLAAEPALAWRGLDDDAAARLSARRSATPRHHQVLAALVAAVASGPFAIAAAFLENSFGGGGGILLFVLFGPAAEEVAKASGAFALSEQRPWLVPSGFALPLITLCSGLVFAAVENIWYLMVLIDDPSDTVVRWRWIGGPLLHGTAAFVTGLGLRRMWLRSLGTGRPRPAHAEPFLIGAIALHGVYNAVAIAAAVTGHLD
jgi:RsiW-degrading membrane proteinase PrsW (M82 family)